MSELLNLTAHELAEKVTSGEVASREAAEAANARVEEVETEINAFITPTPELAARVVAREVARLLDHDPDHPEGDGDDARECSQPLPAPTHHGREATRGVGR